MRYCKQYTKTDCGPTSALNALKWAGYSHTLDRGYKTLRLRCGWESGSGTYVDDIVKILKKYKKFKVKHKALPTMKELDKHLAQGGTFILRYTLLNGKGGHFAFCYGKSDKFFLFYNDSSIKYDRKRTRKTVSRYLQKQIYKKTGEIHPAQVILISKK